MKRFVLYRSQEEHRADCDRFPFDRIPIRIFLDTSVINCLVKWPQCIFEMEYPPDDLDSTLHLDIESLMHVFQVGQRANWDITTSPKALEELSQTKDSDLCSRLIEYGVGLAEYASANESNEDLRYADDLARRLRDSTFMSSLPDIADRDLIAHAIAFRCDAFCTRDRKTIHSKRDSLRQLPIKIVTPEEWWNHVKPWAGLWS